MSSEYVQVHTTLLSHRKVKRLSRDMEMCPRDIRGLLVTLWLNCLVHAADGNLEDWDNEDIAGYAEWEGDPDGFVQALERCGWLVRVDGHYEIHDWPDYSGTIKKSEARAKERQKKRGQRARRSLITNASDPLDGQLVNATCPGDVPGTNASVPGTSRDVPECPALTEQNRTELNRTDLRGPQTLSVGQLNDMVLGWGGGWKGMANPEEYRAHAPFTIDEVLAAKSQALKSAEKKGRLAASAGLIAKIIVDSRVPRSVSATPVAYRMSPKDADIARSIEFARQFREGTG